jgi:hypothetical protein
MLEAMSDQVVTIGRWRRWRSYLYHSHNVNPEMAIFWGKKLAFYVFEGYASKSAFLAGSGLTAKRIGVLVEDLRVAD